MSQQMLELRAIEVSRGSEVPGELLHRVEDVVSDGGEPHEFPNSAPVASMFLTVEWVIALLQFGR